MGRGRFRRPRGAAQGRHRRAGPGPGEVTIDVRAAGMNPADAKHIAGGHDRTLLPLSIGYEVAGIVTALGPGTELASGGGAARDEVVAWPVTGGYASVITVPAADVFAKPADADLPRGRQPAPGRDHRGRTAARFGFPEGRHRPAARGRRGGRGERPAAGP